MSFYFIPFLFTPLNFIPFHWNYIIYAIGHNNVCGPLTPLFNTFDSFAEVDPPDPFFISFYKSSKITELIVRSL
jgi:hypothetical protein